MPRGDFPKREAKKPKKKDDRKPVLTASPVFTPPEVQVVGKKRKPKEEEE